MGLLDDFAGFIKTPEGQGLLSGVAGWAAGARKGTPWNNVGRGGLAGIMGYGNALEQQMQAGQAEQAKALRDIQIKEATQKMADADAMRNFDLGQYYQSPVTQALAGGGGPTIENAAKIPLSAPRLDTQGLVSGMMASRNPALMQQGLGMLTKDEAPVKLGKDEQLLKKNPDGSYKAVASNLVQDVKNGYLLPDGKGGWRVDPALFAAEKELKATGAPKVSVSPTVKVGTTFAEGVAKQGADRLFGQIESAAAAPAKANAANQILTALDTGKVLAGPMTKWSIAARQVIGGDSEKLKATRGVIQGLAKISLEGRQSLRGQGALTDFEQKLLSSAESGDIDNLTVDEIRMIAEGAKKNAEVIHNQGKKAANALRTMPEFKGILPAFDIPDLTNTSQSYAPPPGAVRLKGGG